MIHNWNCICFQFEPNYLGQKFGFLITSLCFFSAC